MRATLQRTMYAAAIDRFGGVEEMRVREIDVPQAGPGEILIRVKTAGVGVWDPFERQGGFADMFPSKPRFPYVLGTDGAGTVEVVGDDVDEFQEGDRVYATCPACPKGGFYAQFAAVRAEFASRIPDKLSSLEAGAMPADAITALRGLDDNLSLRPGQSVLVLGSGGGIGHMAVQLAKTMGARVLGVASGADGAELSYRLGADAVIDGRSDDIPAATKEFAPDGLDAVLLTAGGEAGEKALDVLRKGGRAAYPNGVEPVPGERDGITLTAYDGRPDRGVIRRLNRLIEAGPFQVYVSRTFSLDQVAEAHQALESHYLGKLALRIG